MFLVLLMTYFLCPKKKNKNKKLSYVGNEFFFLGALFNVVFSFDFGKERERERRANNSKRGRALCFWDLNQGLCFWDGGSIWS